MKLKSFYVLMLSAAFSSTLLSCAHKSENVKDLGAASWFSTSSDASLAGSKVYRYQLKNGLKLLVLEDHSSPTFAYNVWYNVGSMDEDKGLTGLAHLFEHMMFKATKNHPDGQYDKILESAGVEGENAFTNRDYTGYVQSLPLTSGNNLELIIQLESDRMVNLIVDENALNKEREVVKNEKRFRNENNPDGKLYERIYEMSYKKHSYHWPVIGYDQDLENAKAKQCLEFYKRYYAPNNATVVVVGDVDHNKVLALVDKYYGPLPASEIKRPVITMDAEQKAEARETMHLKTQVEKLVVSYHVPPHKHADTAALEVMRALLSDGKGSRLYRKLVDAGQASEIEVFSSEHKHPGLLIFWINSQKGKTANKSLSILDKELSDLIQKGPSQDELKRAISQIRLSTFSGMESNEKKAHFIGEYETVVGDFTYGVKLLDEFKKVTAADIQRVAKLYLNKNKRNVLFGLGGK